MTGSRRIDLPARFVATRHGHIRGSREDHPESGSKWHLEARGLQTLRVHRRHDLLGPRGAAHPTYYSRKSSTVERIYNRIHPRKGI